LGDGPDLHLALPAKLTCGPPTPHSRG
jgi:hypothetical protein